MSLWCRKLPFWCLPFQSFIDIRATRQAHNCMLQPKLRSLGYFPPNNAKGRKWKRKSHITGSFWLVQLDNICYLELNVKSLLLHLQMKKSLVKKTQQLTIRTKRPQFSSMLRKPWHSVQKRINYGGHKPEWVNSGQQQLWKASRRYSGQAI